MKYLSYIFFLCILVVLAGCNDDDRFVEPPLKSNGDCNVAFIFNIPSHVKPVSTRTELQEDHVETLDLLLFSSDGDLVRREEITGALLQQSASKITFKTKLSPADAGSTLVFVANARDVMSSIAVGDTKPAALEKLIITRTEKWKVDEQNKMFIPMYAEVTLDADEIKDGYTIGGTNSDKKIDLVRMLSRIDVKVSDASFFMEEIYLCNRNTSGYIAPWWNGNGDIFWNSNKYPNCPSDATLVNDLLNNDLQNDANVKYEVDPAEQNCVGQIYTFESFAASDQDEDTRIKSTCLIIKGKYTDNRSYYYRVDFTNVSKGEYIALLRNHQYVIDIKAVEGVGYRTVEEALNSYTMVSNMHTKVVSWNMGIIKSLVFNGQYMLGMEYDNITIESTSASAYNSVATDFPGGWEIDSYSEWLTVSEVITDDFQNNLHIVAQDNNETKERKGLIIIRAGRLYHEITVIQERKSNKSSRTVKVFSVDDIGSLGNNSGTGLRDTDGIRAILDRHFTPSGLVGIKGFNYDVINNSTSAIDSKLTNAYLATVDVICLTNGNILNDATVNRIMDWLKGSEKRVLVLGMDWTWTNRNVLSHEYIKNDLTVYWNHNESAGTPLTLVPSLGGEYFWKNGPFTNGTDISNAQFMTSGSWWGTAEVDYYSTTITPIFMRNGKMVFGVDKVKRIVYLGNSGYGKVLTTSPYIGTRFNNNSGNANNAIEKVFSNVWAWIVNEVVTAGE